jgi:ribosomal protein L31E
MEETNATKKMEAHPAQKPAQEKKAAAASPSQKKEAIEAKKAETSAKPEKPKANPKKPVEAPKEEKKREIVLERVCVVNLTGAYDKAKTKRLNRAVKLVRAYAARHAKAPLEKVRLATSVNELIRSHGSSWVPKRIKIRLTKDKEGSVLAEVSK